VDGRVLQVSVSDGGVPKLPVARAWVSRFGVEGDRQRHDTVHGGPHRAVALFAIEAIERVQADGHPIEPGSVGENLTTTGVELALLPVGTRLAIGDRLILELAGPDNPCDEIKASFRDGKSGRISILTHPTDSRMYARVLEEGEVRPNDPIRVLPPANDSTAEVHALLDRADAAMRHLNVSIWRAAADAGYDVRVVDDGELAMVASPELPGRHFNRATCYRQLPNLLPRMEAFFRRHGTVGWIGAESPPWPGAIAERPARFFRAEPEAVAAAPLPDGIVFEPVDDGSVDDWARVLDATALGAEPGQAAVWEAIEPRLLRMPGNHRYIAREAGRPVAVAGLVVRRRIGLLAAAAVVPGARGRGIHRSLIAHRARAAAELGATHVVAAAAPDSVSARNLEAMGLAPFWERASYRFDPAEHPA
jgi:MOSC domain-containing protein YiiM